VSLRRTGLLSAICLERLDGHIFLVDELQQLGNFLTLILRPLHTRHPLLRAMASMTCEIPGQAVELKVRSNKVESHEYTYVRLASSRTLTTTVHICAQYDPAAYPWV